MTMPLSVSLRQTPPAAKAAFGLSVAVHIGALLWFGPLSMHAPQPAAFDIIEVALVGEPTPRTSLKALVMPRINHNTAGQQAAPETEEHGTSTPDSVPAPTSNGNEEPLVESRYNVSSLNNPKPPYPFAARRNGMEGSVVLRAHVLEDGHCAEVKLLKSSGNDLLDNSALETVKRWRFVPASRGGTAVASWVEIPISFRLRNDPVAFN